MPRKVKAVPLALVAFAVLSQGTAFGRQTVRPTGFEQATLTLDTALDEARIANSVLLVVVRPGSVDASPRLSDFRIKILRLYYEERARFGVPVFFAVGDQAEGMARIEFYISGKRVEHKGVPDEIIVSRLGMGNLWSEDPFPLLKPSNWQRFLKYYRATRPMKRTATPN